MMEGCDTLLMVGSSFPYSEWLPEPGQARGVQIDIDARLIGMRYPMEVNLVGDAAETLRALIPLLERKADRAWREEIEAGVARWWRILEEQAHQDADPINPQLVFHELSLAAARPRDPHRRLRLGDELVGAPPALRDGMNAALSGTLATMCPAVPYALAAKFAHPDRPVIAAIGDGAMQMLGINALIDVARYHDRWTDQRLVVCVLHNDDLNQVTWEQRVMSGDPKLDASQVLPDFDYADYARLIGLHGDPRRPPRGRRPGLGRGARRRPPGRARGRHRPGGPAAAAAHPLRAGQGDGRGAARRATRRGGDDQAVAEGQARRVHDALGRPAPPARRPARRAQDDPTASRAASLTRSAAASVGTPSSSRPRLASSTVAPEAPAAMTSAVGPGPRSAAARGSAPSAPHRRRRRRRPRRRPGTRPRGRPLGLGPRPRRGPAGTPCAGSRRARRRSG